MFEEKHDPARWVSYSSLAMHRHCPQKWFYARVLDLHRIEDDEPAVERDFGSWWHALRASDSLARGRRLRTLKHVPEKIKTVDGGPTFDSQTVDPEVVLDSALRWYAAQHVEVRQAWENRLGGSLGDRMRDVDARWRKQWGRDTLAEEPLAVEMGWRRTLVKSSEETPEVVVVGYVDEVYRDRRKGMVVVRDHKSARALKPQTALDDMMDSQLQMYAWGIAPVVKEWDVGVIGATAYDRVRSAAPKQPKLNLDGTLSKTVLDFDLDTYKTWAEGEDGQGRHFPGRLKDGSGAGRYRPEREMLERLSTPTARSVWLHRTLTPLNAHLIHAHLASARDTAADMSMTQVRASLSGEAARNLTKGCEFCDFLSLCRYQMIAGPEADYVPRDHGLSEPVNQR